MTASETQDRTGFQGGILAPYRNDPDSRSARRRRRWGVGLFTAFCLFWGLVFAFIAPALIAILVAPIGIMLLLVFWAMPDIRSAPTGVLSRWFFIFTWVVIVWPYYLSISVPHSGLPWVSLQRLADVPMAIVLLVCAGCSKAFRARCGEILGGERPITTLLIAFVVIQTYSIFLSRMPFASMNKWLDGQISCTAMFFAAAYLFSKPGAATRWANVLWGAAVFTGLIGIWEWRIHRLPWFGHLPAFFQIDPVVAKALTPNFRDYTQIYRVQSTFQSALGLGEYMSLTLPFVLHFALQDRRLWLRGAAWLSAALICFVTFISNARSGLIGVLIDIGLYGFYWGVVTWKRRPSGLIGQAVTLSYPLISVAAVASTIFIGRIHGAVWGDGAQASSTDARKVQYDMGLPMVFHNPIGHGIGQSAMTLGFRIPSGLLTIDTYYLAIALDYGVLGFLAFYGMFLYAAYRAGRIALEDDNPDRETTLLAPACMALVSFIVIKSVYSEDFNHPLYFMVLGMVVALTNRVKISRTAIGRKTADRISEVRRSVIPLRQPASMIGL